MANLIGSYLTTSFGREGRCNIVFPRLLASLLPLLCFIHSPRPCAAAPKLGRPQWPPPWLHFPLVASNSTLSTQSPRAAPLAPCLPLPSLSDHTGCIGHGAANSCFLRSPARGHPRNHRGPAWTPAGSASRHQGPGRPRLRTISYASASMISSRLSVSVKGDVKLLRSLLCFNLVHVLLYPTSNASSASGLHAARLPRQVILLHVANYGFLPVSCIPRNPLRRPTCPRLRVRFHPCQEPLGCSPRASIDVHDDQEMKRARDWSICRWWWIIVLRILPRAELGMRRWAVRGGEQTDAAGKKFAHEHSYASFMDWSDCHHGM
jgi:hypothetical protein